MRSVSSLFINWIQPDLDTEEWEFSKHPAKQPFYQKHALSWESLSASFPKGKLTPYPRSDKINNIPVALSYHTFDDYCVNLAKAKRGYRLNYNRLETALQHEGSLTLPAPVILLANEEALLFSGYRRLCLAWNYGMTPFVWLVPLT